jgi:hypothetical protein
MALGDGPTGRDGKDLGWRVRLFALGAGLGIGGIVLENRLMIWAAIAVLGGGFALRFLGSDRPPPGDD